MLTDEVDDGNEIKALISLVDEPDEAVYAEIFDKIIKTGDKAIPYLETAWENSLQPNIQKRIENITHTIQFAAITKELADWVKGEMDLLEGAIIIARYHYPHLKEDEIHYALNKIRKEIWIELNDNLTALEQIKVFNHVFYEIIGFNGNIDNYHDPQNSFINFVLNSKKGNPLSLGIVYIILAQRLELPVYGVNLPEHFILAYTAKSVDPTTLLINDKNVLFYINAFSKGLVFSHKEVEEFVKKLDLEPIPSYFNPCNNKEIILRMLNNLIVSYDKAGDNEKKSEIEHLKEILI
ncbi:MAG: transglutaminase-like domain-containing protein [Bacteroidota bacterium]